MTKAHHAQGDNGGKCGMKVCGRSLVLRGYASPMMELIYRRIDI